jgi:hypothetical protein
LRPSAGATWTSPVGGPAGRPGTDEGPQLGPTFRPLEPELVATLSDLRLRKDRERASPLFPDFSAQGLRLAMERACRAAEIPHYHAHDLRPPVHQPARGLGPPHPARAAVVGHSRASTTLDTYFHVLLDEPAERLAQLRCGVLWCASRAPIVEWAPRFLLAPSTPLSVARALVPRRMTTARDYVGGKESRREGAARHNGTPALRPTGAEPQNHESPAFAGLSTSGA